LPSHSTHLLQPLDISEFQPFKHRHQQALHEAVQYGALELTKLDFLTAFQRIHERTFKRKTILLAWEKAGLFQFNPTLVKDKMAVFESEAALVALKRPRIPPLNSQPFQQTPTTQTYQAHIRYLQRLILSRRAFVTSLWPSFAKVSKVLDKENPLGPAYKEREIKKS
jgi:hypothetical protein